MTAVEDEVMSKLKVALEKVILSYRSDLPNLPSVAQNYANEILNRAERVLEEAK